MKLTSDAMVITRGKIPPLRLPSYKESREAKTEWG